MSHVTHSTNEQTPASDSFRVVEAGLLEKLQSDLAEALQRLAQAEGLQGELGLLQRQIQESENRIYRLEKNEEREKTADFYVSVIIQAPELAGDKVPNVVVDEVKFVASFDEARKYEATVSERERRSGRRRKVLVSQQTSLKPVTF